MGDNRVHWWWRATYSLWKDKNYGTDYPSDLELPLAIQGHITLMSHYNWYNKKKCTLLSGGYKFQQ